METGNNLPAIIKSGSDMKLAVLKQESVRKNMKPTDLMIMETGARSTTIKNTPDADLIKEITTKANFIAKDVGIKGDLDHYQVIRFYDILRKYYSQLSTSEVKLAFELAMVGELDEYLPLDKNGSPDKNHYQEFSVEYITKILNAYIKRSSVTWNQAYTLLPEHEEVVTEEQKIDIRNNFLMAICEQFDRFIKDEPVVFFIPWLVINELIKANLIESEPEVTNEDKAAAMLNIISNSLSEGQRKEIKKAYSENRTHSYLTVEARHVRDMIVIKEVFAELKKSGKHIKDCLKWL
jgi:hemolysin-activating ACP:hemolysin acyltransferase